MDRTKIARSSNIAEVGYDPEQKHLEIKFHDGGTYRYHDVPASTHADMMKAKSAGGFVAEKIRGKFRTERVGA